jgi:hypothetical protein
MQNVWRSLWNWKATSMQPQALCVIYHCYYLRFDTLIHLQHWVVVYISFNLLPIQIGFDVAEINLMSQLSKWLLVCNSKWMCIYDLNLCFFWKLIRRCDNSMFSWTQNIHASCHNHSIHSDCVKIANGKFVPFVTLKAVCFFYGTEIHISSSSPK